MKQLILVTLILSPIVSLGQETIKKLSNSTGNKEVYYVLKSDKKVKHGTYQKLGLNDYVLTEGFYKNGLRDSIWIEYWTPPTYKTKGTYLNDKRTGLWEFYNRLGVLEQKYDLTNKELIYDVTMESNKEKKYKIVSASDTIETKLERPPVYIGGKTKMQNVLTKGFTFPRAAMQKGVSGQVQVGFIIDKDGKADNFKIIRGLGYGCDEEALRMAKQISDSWVPGIYKGEAVNVENIISITFKGFSNN